MNFLHTLANHPDFIESVPSTHFIDDNVAKLTANNSDEETLQLIIAAFVYLAHTRIEQCSSPWNTLTAFSLNNSNTYVLPFEQGAIQCQRDCDEVALNYLGHDYSGSCAIAGNKVTAFINGEKHTAKFVLDNQSITVIHNGNSHEFALKDKHYVAETKEEENSLQAPLNGTVVKHVAKTGENVGKGDPIIIIEAMKMEYTLTAPFDGVLTQFYFEQGDLVNHGDLLAQVEEQ